MTQNRTTTIKGGPGRFDLMLSLFDGQRKSFQTDDGVCSILITDLQRAVGGKRRENEESFDNWTLGGYGILNNDPQGLHPDFPPEIIYFKGIYDLRHNTGSLTIYKDEESQKVLEKTVEELDISVRAYNCLKLHSINTVGELVKESEATLLKKKGFVRRVINELITELATKGVFLSR